MTIAVGEACARHRSKNLQVVDFRDIRSDWFASGDYMVRLLIRGVRLETGASQRDAPLVFAGFPSQWIPLFEWLGLRWEGVCAEPSYVPFVGDAGRTIVKEIAIARRSGQLRLLVETFASCDTVLAEVLPKLDARLTPHDAVEHGSLAEAPIRLTNWHSYGRSEIRRFEADLRHYYQQTKRDVIFLPCGRARPYDRSPTHRRLRAALIERGIDLNAHDVIVITSLGPVPEAMWRHPVVLRYDTGVRDVYRMLILFRRMFQGVRYRIAWNCLNLQPYQDLIGILKREGFIDHVKSLSVGKQKRLPAYNARTVKSVASLTTGC